MVTLKLARNSEGTAEIFRSVQGEGRNVGRVRTFVRLSGCNLHCVWCDTAYTWNWEGSPWPHINDRPGAPRKFNAADEMIKHTIAEVADAVDAQPAEGVVITGGEPLMQMGGVLALIGELKARAPGLAVEIETNGVIVPSADLTDCVDLFMVSPKLGHSGNAPEVALNPISLAAFARLDKAVFKFVARDGGDIALIQDLAWQHGIAASRIYVMPEGTHSDVIIARGSKLIQSVIDAGFNYTDRLHIHLFGEKRGV